MSSKLLPPQDIIKNRKVRAAHANKSNHQLIVVLPTGEIKAKRRLLNPNAVAQIYLERGSTVASEHPPLHSTNQLTHPCRRIPPQPAQLSQPHPTQPNLTQPNPTQPNPTQLYPTLPNPVFFITLMLMDHMPLEAAWTKETAVAQHVCARSGCLMRCKITLVGRVLRLCHQAADEYRSAARISRGREGDWW